MKQLHCDLAHMNIYNVRSHYKVNILNDKVRGEIMFIKFLVFVIIVSSDIQVHIS